MGHTRRGEALPRHSTTDPGKGQTVVLTRALRDRLVGVCRSALPGKAYGLVGGKDSLHPETVYPCATNLRSDPEWSSVFESFGEFYRDPDRGFVVSLEEQKRILETMASRGELFVGVYHSHRWTGAVPSELDVALHVGSGVLCYIVSVEYPEQPELKIYRVNGSRYEEVPFRLR